jgi:hypothetical protein
MNDTFYVVSKETADAKDYIGAVAFNRTDKDADNEAAANAFLDERKIVAPWHNHSVMTADDFDKANADSASSDPAPSDPAPTS